MKIFIIVPCIWIIQFFTQNRKWWRDFNAYSAINLLKYADFSISIGRGFCSIIAILMKFTKYLWIDTMHRHVKFDRVRSSSLLVIVIETFLLVEVCALPKQFSPNLIIIFYMNKNVNLSNLNKIGRELCKIWLFEIFWILR